MVLAEGLLPGIAHRPAELGRIRLGDKSERGLPISLRTFRLTSASKATLDAAAVLYGGRVAPWEDAPDPGMYELVTETAELDVLIPGSLQTVSQAYELWQGGTCERRCDGTTEQISGAACPCDPDARECDVVTRVKVMLPRLPGLGVWRLDTSGWMAATTLPSTITLLAQMTGGQWIPAVLRAEQRSKRTRLPNGKVETHRFVVPVLDLPGSTIGELVQLAPREDLPRIESGERPVPLTARDRVAQARAAVETAQEPPRAVGPAAADDEPPLPPEPTTRAEANGQAPAEAAALCASESPYGDGATCSLEAGHERKTCKGADGSTWEVKRR